jgi:DNA-binding Lrp family transcriptional regulator
MKRKYVQLTDEQVENMVERQDNHGTSYGTFSDETGASRNTCYNRMKQFRERREQNGSSQ